MAIQAVESAESPVFTGRRHFRQVVRYLWKVADARNHEPMVRSFSSIDKSSGEMVVTVAESLREAGRAEGEEVGRVKTANWVLKCLLQRFPAASPELQDRVRSASLEELFRWSQAIQLACSVEDLLDA